MKFIQKYKLFRNARSAIKNTNAAPNFVTIFGGAKYILETERYSITAESHGTANPTYRTIVQDHLTKQTAAFEGDRAMDLYLKLYDKYAASVIAR